MTKVQLISDIHLEFPANRSYLEKRPFEHDAEVLIIAGDFCPIPQREESYCQKFLDMVSDKYERVIIVNGNHDYYGTNAHDIHKEKTKLRKNVECVNRNVIKYKNTRYICATLWGNPLPREERYIVNYLYDFTAIANMTMMKFKMLNELDSAFIKRELQKPYDGNTVVVTHHIPSRYQIHPQYSLSPTNGGFASSEEQSFNYNFSHWVYGHTHTSYDKVICDSQFYCNPLGYVQMMDGIYRKDNQDQYFLENTGYNPALYFDS